MTSGAHVLQGIHGRVAAGALLFLATSMAPSRSSEAAGPAPGTDPAALAALEASLPTEQRAELAFLQHLGWRFARDPTLKKAETRAGTPCYRKDIEAAWAAGDLRVALPTTMAPNEVAEFGAALAPLTESIESRCAFKQKIAIATREATRKLAAVAARGAYTFPQFIIVNSPWFRCTLPQPEWRKVGVENLCTGSTARAIEAVYNRGGVAECYTGQWVAIYATQYELYGPAWFDSEVKKEDLRLGRPRESTQTSIGQYVDETKTYVWRSLLIPERRMREDAGLVLAELGPKAFSGLTGILQNEAEDIGANENFMIVSMSPRAMEEMKAHGGLRRVLDVTREANLERKASHRGTSASERLGHVRRHDELMADPLLKETLVYVQPFGVVPLEFVARREMEEEGKPVKIRIYTNGLDEYLYQRYRTAWKGRWMREQGLAPQAPPPPPAAPGVPGSVPAR